MHLYIQTLSSGTNVDIDGKLARDYRLVRANSLNYVILMFFNCEVTLILSLDLVRRYSLLNYLLKDVVIRSALKLPRFIKTARDQL